MTTRQTLAGGGWVELRAPSEVTERLRRPVKGHFAKLMTDPAFASTIGKAQANGVRSVEDLDESTAAELAAGMASSLTALDELNDLLVVAKVAAWSFGDTVTADALLDLPGPVYDELRALCSTDMRDLLPEFGPSTDPQSPTVPSTA